MTGTRRKNGGTRDKEAVVGEDGETPKCPVCDKTDNRKSDLECEICLTWFHASCVGVSPEKFKQIVAHEFHWFCEDCDVLAVEILGKMKIILDQNDDLKTKIHNLNTKIASLETKNQSVITECEQKVSEKFDNQREDLKEEIKNELKESLKIEPTEPLVVTIEDDEDSDENPNAWQTAGGRRNNKAPTPILSHIIQEEMMERQKIDLNKKNLVIAGIAENNSAAEDMEAVKTLIEEELDIVAEIDKVVRCGREKSNDLDKPRFLKLFMKTQDNRKKILQNAKNLRNSTDEHIKSKVYISPDLTKKQQLAAKNLRDRLKTVKRENPGKTYKIQRDEIVEVE